MKPKIYISHAPLSIEETARRVGVSERRMKELIALAAELSGSKAPHPLPSNRIPRGPKQAQRTSR
jgi:hypothetical protein